MNIICDEEPRRVCIYANSFISGADWKPKCVTDNALCIHSRKILLAEIELKKKNWIFIFECIAKRPNLQLSFFLLFIFIFIFILFIFFFYFLKAKLHVHTGMAVSALNFYQHILIGNMFLNFQHIHFYFS